MVYKTIKKDETNGLLPGQTWTVTSRIPVKKSEIRTLAKLFSVLRVFVKC